MRSRGSASIARTGNSEPKRPSDLEHVYAAIPDNTDILVSHQPPYGHGHGDCTFNVDSGRVEHVGSPEPLHAIERVRPRLVIISAIMLTLGTVPLESIHRVRTNP